MHSMTFRLVGDSALRAVDAALAQALSRWSAEWGVDSSVASVSVQRACEASPADGINWQRRGLHAWLACPPTLEAVLQDAIFGPVANGRPALAHAGACQARADLLEALQSAFSAAPGHAHDENLVAPPDGVWRRGAGAVAACIRLGQLRLHMLLDAPAVQSLQRPAAALPALAPADLAQSVARVPVVLELNAGSARVGLGSLMALSAGDVIRLGIPSEAPLSLRSAAGKTLFGAYLGRSDGELAVEIVSRTSLTVGAAS